MTELNQIVSLMVRPLIIALVVLGLQGCAISSITSGFSGGLFGKKKTTASTAGNEGPSVSEEKLLAAAQSDVSGTGDSLGYATGCPQFIPSPTGRLYTKYEPGREGNSLGIVYRGEITKTARECQIETGEVGVKYGFAGRVLLGPRGQDGTIQLPMTVQVTDRDNNPVRLERMTVSVTVARNDPIGFFSVVKVVKFPIQPGVRAPDYKILVAFDQAGAN